MSSTRLLHVVLLLLVSFPAAFGQLSTEDHLAESGFWPTQSHADRAGFVGSAACARCHSGITAAQGQTPMARTLMTARLSEILHASPDLSFAAAGYNYAIHTPGANAASSYSIHGSGQTRSFPLSYAFGTGRVGQSYLFKKDDGQFYEARVTWFRRLNALGFTPARALLTPSGIDEAMYRPIPQAEVLRCFNCHSTGADIGGQFDEQGLTPGVTCEACHGPGASHATQHGMSPGGKTTVASTLLNPARLSPTDSVEFCGACHGSWWDVKLAGVKGVSTTRSAPYRLVTSKCWGKGEDPRITCIACHDPHEQLETRSEAYDGACLQCHATRGSASASHPTPLAKSLPARERLQAACPVATSKCTSCHMPKVFVPEMNDTFTDHRIRIVRQSAAFPE